MTRTMYDAAYPPSDPHLDVCGFYIGGDTPHVWTDAEIAAQSARWRLPIYTCDNPSQRDPVRDSTEAVAWLRAHRVPAGSALALDYETAVYGAYVTSFDATVTAAGWSTLLYGSLSTVTRNPRPSAGYWTASWSGAPHLDPGAAATQYISDTQLGRPYDLSVVADSLVLWDTRPPAPAPASAHTSVEVEMIQLMVPKSATDPTPGSIWLLSGPLYVQVADSADNQAFTAAGVQTAHVDWAQHEAILAAAAALRAPVTLTGSIPLTLSATGTVAVG